VISCTQIQTHDHDVYILHCTTGTSPSVHLSVTYLIHFIMYAIILRDKTSGQKSIWFMAILHIHIQYRGNKMVFYYVCSATYRNDNKQ